VQTTCVTRQEIDDDFGDGHIGIPIFLTLFNIWRFAINLIEHFDVDSFILRPVFCKGLWS